LGEPLQLLVIIIPAEPLQDCTVSRIEVGSEPQPSDVVTRQRQAAHHPTTLLLVKIGEDRLDLEAVRDASTAAVVREILGRYPELVSRVPKRAYDDADRVDEIGLATVVLTDHHAERATQFDRTVQVTKALEPNTSKLQNGSFAHSNAASTS
jgi:hypothetical protein